MPTPEERHYFDMHVHPSLKAGLSINKKYSAWEYITIFEGRAILIKIILVLLIISPFILHWLLKDLRYSSIGAILLYSFITIVVKSTSPERVFGIIFDIFRLPTYKIRQMINSQANLTQVNKNHHVVVAALIAMEKPFAESTVYRAIGLISPLDGKIMRNIRKDQVTYYQLLESDITHLLNAKNIKIANKFSDIKEGELYVVLSVEGAHSFQGNDLYASILNNFYIFKNKYRLHHLTLAHLTAQPACVHCLGVRLKAGNIDTIRRPGFRPDSTKIGISPLGKDIICMAYADPDRLVLIDVKHMSFVSRLQFYEIRKNNSAQKWNEIPLIASHVGVTGISFKVAQITKILYGKKAENCDEVFWVKQNTALNTFLNPWTINLFDEDIAEILTSSGMIGIILDERVIGFGTLIGEFMSKKEVTFLDLKGKIVVPKNNPIPHEIDLSSLGTSINCEREEGMNMNMVPIIHTKSPNDLQFDPREQPSEIRQMIVDDVTHIDYVAGNIIHIIKVGHKNNYYGQVKDNPHVLDCICIGSDLDGIVDAINFPGKIKSEPINQHDWITSDKYSRLKSDLEDSLKKYIQKDQYFINNKIIINISNFCDKLFYKNGYEFLKKHFN